MCLSDTSRDLDTPLRKASVSGASLLPRTGAVSPSSRCSSHCDRRSESVNNSTRSGLRKRHDGSSRSRNYVLNDQHADNRRPFREPEGAQRLAPERGYARSAREHPARGA